MIGTRTPFRVSFAGGGSDLWEFYSKHPGSVLSTTIDKYMFIFIHAFFDKRIQVKYSKTELVEDVNDIKHPIARELLKKIGLTGVDITSIADIPAGTGLGSSCSFTVGLLHALYAYTNKYPHKEKLAREACELEIDILKEPIGKQDQYAAAYGGLNFMTFYPNESVNVESILMPASRFSEFEQNLMMFYVGGARPASDVLSDQKSNVMNDKKKFNSLIIMSDLARQLKEVLLFGNLSDVGSILDEGWQLKKTLSTKISEDKIDYYYEVGMKNGASGGKLLGAGGGGFLLFYCEKEHQEKLRGSLKDLKELKFNFDNFGTKVIYVGENEE